MGVLGLLGWTVYVIFSWLSSLESKVVIAIIAACFTIVSSTVALVLGRYFEKKKEQEVAHRDKKVVLYDELTSRLFKVFQDTKLEEGIEQEESEEGADEDLVMFLREVQRKLILWGGPSTVVSYADWHKKLTASPGDPKAETMVGMVDFFLSLRSDLGLSNKGISREHIYRFMLQQPDLFAQMYEANNDVRFSEIVEAEKALKG